METEVDVQCPYCGEVVAMTVDADVGGTFIQDCEVCCHPWQVRVRRGRHGELSVDVNRADGSE